MKRFTLLLCLCLLFAGIAAAQNATEVSEVGKDKFEANFPSGGHLRLDIRSGEIRITGTDENKIRIQYGGSDAGKLSDVKVTFKITDTTGDLRISGGPRNNFRIIVEVPKALDLYLRVPFGDIEVEGITGNKDVELHAGELRLDVGSASDYGHVDASVNSGELDANPFDVEKGGLFRSFKKEGSGKYRLHAHVGAGQLTLQ